jgi:hypothetical protein
MRALAIVILALCSGCSTVVAPSVANDVVPVEVLTGGDDGLTQRLADAICSEFERSAHFTLIPAAGSETLRITIPTHVDWEQVSGRTRVTFRLKLERGGRNLRANGGRCWEEDLRECAHQVLGAATLAVRP